MFDAINAAKGVMPRPPPGCGGALTNGEAEAPCLGGACIPPPPPAPVASYGYGGRLWSPPKWVFRRCFRVILDDFKVTSGECWPLLTILDGKSMGHL